MKGRIVKIGVTFVVLVTAMMASLVISVNLSGGLPPSQSWVKMVPVVGAFIRIRAGEEESDAEETKNEHKTPAEYSSEGSPFVALASKEQLVELCNQLREKLQELEAEKKSIAEKNDELQLWEQELDKQKDALLEKVESERRKLDERRERLDRMQSELEEVRVRIAEREEENLQKTASVFGTMDAAGAADIFTRMFETGEEKTVVKILYLMRERNAGNVLNEIDDPEVAASITKRLSYVYEERKGN